MEKKLEKKFDAMLPMATAMVFKALVEASMIRRKYSASILEYVNGALDDPAFTDGWQATLLSEQPEEFKALLSSKSLLIAGSIALAEKAVKKSMRERLFKILAEQAREAVELEGLKALAIEVDFRLPDFRKAEETA